jgi:hypothetical protein
MNENRRMKPVVIVLRSGRRGKRGNDRGVNLIAVYCKQV